MSRTAFLVEQLRAVKQDGCKLCGELADAAVEQLETMDANHKRLIHAATGRHQADLAIEVERLTEACAMKDRRIDWTVGDNARKAMLIADLETTLVQIGAKCAQGQHCRPDRRTAETATELRADANDAADLFQEILRIAMNAKGAIERHSLLGQK